MQKKCSKLKYNFRLQNVFIIIFLCKRRRKIKILGSFQKNIKTHAADWPGNTQDFNQIENLWVVL